MRYAIGSRVRVQVSRVDLDGRKIDFRLVREGEELLSRAMKDKGAPREPKNQSHQPAAEAPPKAKAGKKRSGGKSGGGASAQGNQANPAASKAAARGKSRKSRR